MSSDIFGIQKDEWLGEEKEQPNRWLLPVLLACGGALIAGLLFLWGMHFGQSGVPSLLDRNSRLQQQVAVLVHGQTHCSTYSSDVRNIEHLINRGDFQAGADLAGLDLSNRQDPACPQSGLSSVWYTASIDAMFSIPPTQPDDTRLVLRWESIDARANQLGLGTVTRLSPLTVAVFAYNNHQWELCRQGLVQALDAGLITASDRVQIALYQAATRNEGHEIAFHSTGSRKFKGERLLALAADIGKYVHRQEATVDLEQLLGRRWSAIVSPVPSDPILTALKSAG